ncbi:MAG: alpha/beta hydrolase [Planctomycetota bacterium JB042]
MRPEPLLIAAVASLLFAAPPTRAADSSIDYLDVDSKALRKSVRCGVYLPPGYDASGDVRYPTLVFLHGMRGSERKWENRGVGERLDALIEKGVVDPMIVVCPNGENSMYVNWRNGKADWADFVRRDLVEWVDARYRTVADRSGRGLTGDSMGGYGALNIAFQHPDVFGSVSAHSAALYPVDPDDLPEWIKRMADRWGPVYGSPVDVDHWRGNNPLHLAATQEAESLRSLSIYFDCGDRDRYGFDSSNVDLDGILDDRDVPHEFHLRDGGHGREYFEAYVTKSLEFHGRVFRASAAPRPGADEGDEGDAEDAEEEAPPDEAPARREF